MEWKSSRDGSKMQPRVLVMTLLYLLYRSGRGEVMDRHGYIE